MRGEQFVSTNQGKPAIAATTHPGEFQGKGVVPAKDAQAAPAPAPSGSAAPEIKKEPPSVEKAVKPELAPNAPKVEEKPPVVEKPMKPQVAPTKVEEKPPAVEKVVKPLATPNTPKIEEKRPPVEPVRPEPPNGAQKAVARQPVQPERRPGQAERKPPEAKECGRPGQLPCPK
jgi:hypothetical protein